MSQSPKQTTSGKDSAPSIRVVGAGANTVAVTVTSGTMAGRSARIITVPPSAAYFNETPPAEKKRA